MKKLASAAAVAALLLVPLSANAETAAELQARIEALLAQIQQLQALIGASTSGTVTASSAPTASASCPEISRTLKLGMSGADVTRLQQFLAGDPSVYPEATVSGYYGALTQAAVQRWQTKFNIVSSGTAATTGFGVVGPRTAAAFAQQCTGGSGASPTVGGYIQVTPISGQSPLGVTVQATVNTVKSCAGATYTLDFGDGGAVQNIPVPAGNCGQLQQSYTHTYAYGGTYLVKLSAGAHQTNATVTVSGQPAPTTPTRVTTAGLPPETFNASPASGSAPLTVTFFGVVNSNDAGFCTGGCSSVLDFGDGKSAAVALPSSVGGWLNYSVKHTYANPGGYRATLYQGAAGASQPIVGATTIVVSAAPSASPSYEIAGIVPNYEGNANAIKVDVSVPASCPVFSLDWGDGTPVPNPGNCQASSQTGSAVISKTHTYAAAGSYTLTLKDGSGTVRGTASITISN